MANVITTILKLNATDLKTGLKSTQQQIAQTDGVVQKAKVGWSSLFTSFATSPVAIAGATAAVGTFAAASVSAASDLEESINAVNVTFGESADKILEFGENAAKSVGLAASEFNQLATPLGSILKNAGFQMDEVADKTIILTQRAADMASVFNTDVSEALGAIQAGLRGEQDPLERFGVGLSAAKVEARALADTGKDSAKALTDQEKQLARVNIILDQTNQTAGDFNETQDSLANQTKVLKAEFENLKATAGQQLIPVLSDLAGLLLEVSENAGKAKDTIEDIPGGKGLLDALGTNLFELPKKSKAEWDDLGRKIGIVPEKVAEIGSKRAEFEALIAAGNESKEALTGTADAAGEAADEVVDLGDKAANAGPKIGDMVGALDAARQHLEELNDEFKSDAADFFAAGIQRVKDAIDDAFGALDEDLDLLDLLDDIKDQFDAIAEAAKEANDEEGVRNFNREIRTLQGQLLEMVRTRDDLSAKQQIEFVARIRQGDIDELHRVLDDLTKDRFINVITRAAPQDAFASLNTAVNFAAGTATPVFNGASGPVSTDARTIINYYPVGSTPTTVYQDQQTDFRRNGLR